MVRYVFSLYLEVIKYTLQVLRYTIIEICTDIIYVQSRCYATHYMQACVDPRRNFYVPAHKS